jgi:hypothetical protein
VHKNPWHDTDHTEARDDAETLTLTSSDDRRDHGADGVTDAARPSPAGTGTEHLAVASIARLFAV